MNAICVQCQLLLPQNKCFNSLLAYPKQVNYMGWQNRQYIKTEDGLFGTHPQNLIKTKEGLFAFINGTGRLYKVALVQNGYQLIRLDSTNVWGYNIGSFAFGYNNKIYNIGGYGIWRLNGQLRVFNTQANQWDIVKLNKEIPVLIGNTEGLLWYDENGSKLYTGYYPLRNEAVKTDGLDETTYVYDVMQLDLVKKEWVKLGELNASIKDKIATIKPIVMSAWGQIVSIGDKICLLDFVHNNIATLDSRKDYYQTISRSLFDNTFYFKDSLLFISNYKQNSLDSMNIHKADFIDSGEHIYTPKNYTSYIVYLLLFIIFVLAACWWIIGILRKRKNTLLASNITEHAATNDNSIFDEQELNLIKFFTQYSNSGQTVSAEEINKVLGTIKKSVEIQKKHRSDIINNINRKYGFIKKTEEVLIDKRRTTSDGRAFEYFIEFEKMKEITNVIYSNCNE